jgi:hypothetical protein
MGLKIMGTSVSFQFRNEQFCARSRKSRDCAEAYKWYVAQGYVAQAIPKIDTEIAEKGHFWKETRLDFLSKTGWETAEQNLTSTSQVIIKNVNHNFTKPNCKRSANC